MLRIFDNIGVLSEVRSHLNRSYQGGLQLPKDYFPSLKEKAISISEEILKKNFTIGYCWGVNIKPNDSGVFHNHLTYPIVGVYYVSTTKNCGNLIFKDMEIEIEPVNDRLVLFSGDLIHGIGCNNSTHDRISIGLHLKIQEKNNV